MNIRKDFDLSKILWYNIGGKARFLLEAQNKEDIFKALDFIDKNHIKKTFVVGLGSNLLFSDNYFDGAVIRIVCGRSDPALSAAGRLSSTQGPTLRKNADGYVEAFAGETLDNLIKFSFRNKHIGLEWAGGLPGTVGAAVRGNVGAFGGEIKDILFQAEILEMRQKGFEVIQMNHVDMNFSYRSSIVKQSRSMVVLSATFILSETDKEQIQKAEETYKLNIKYREDRHPLEYPNCGSVFKNIVRKEEVEKIISLWPDIEEKTKQDWHGKVAMGYVIKRLGFSGLKVGNAKVSEKHANFIVNLGGGKALDVIKIIDQIKQKFSDVFGFTPEVEVEIVG